MPTFLQQARYCDPQDPKNGILQFASGTDREAFEQWHLSPDIMNNFNTFMTGVRGSRPSWVHWWPVESRILQGATEDEESVLLVDVAGGLGHDAREFKAKYPHSKGKIVLQDLPAVIGNIKRFNGDIELMEYNFFTPQPIKGKERTESQWKKLLSMAGLHVNSFLVPKNNTEGIIEAELA
ncbi:hypothetical protein ONZ43_g1529 [Nemania bipapillata]|uniref:Uncharacterized protein n=1 Tax=Nemania bipapillata TaxID=110536 RepID=A0ACC2J498_9PEZI|nr:hypothetical protein ONZ43_g1529 [Nemania bipapillata]